ncbi:MAG: DUF5103 domain-containing protein [Bacteroidales bacterium]|jgi:hypothetical protein|nr:DUF5103 domain-containing protein [Bacteroidales bacterium]
MRKYITLFFCFTLFAQVFGQPFSSIQCYPPDNFLGYPVIRLNSDDKLFVSFDEITSDARTLEYRYILCDADWKPSSLQTIQYIRGNTYAPVSDILFSLNTRTDYTHYEFTFPDDYTNFLVSGNYKCEIYDVNEPEITLLTIHFFVTENAVAINAKVIPPKRVEFRRSKQELEFEVTALNFDILQPYQNLTVLVRQNERTDNVRQISPQYIVGKTLKFADSEDLIFDGSDEFRNFDTKFLDFSSIGVENITIENFQYVAQVYAGESRATKTYRGDEDLNGRFVIRADRKLNPNTEAEYIFVHFPFFVNYQGKQTSVHVFGQLTNWTINENSEMAYDFEQKCYIKTLFLKQGFYDYQYVLYDKVSETIDNTRFEGNHQETKNDNTINVYYRGNSDNHDRLLGATIVKSRE